MKNKKPNAELVWKQLEDLLVPRHIRLSAGPVRGAVRRLVAQGALRLVQRSKTGHVVEVRPPEEIRPEKLNGVEHRTAVREDGAGADAAINIEEADFLQNTTLRKAIHARERGQCFYCMAGPRRRCSAWTMWCRGFCRSAIPTATWSRAASGQGNGSAQKRFSELRRGYPPMHHEDHDGRRFAGIFSSVCMVICL